ncbi:hypothetical protein [Jeotgalibacillus malaysiensis]|uniref:hypothetical protein n=1 Tax=Jeotgalibacillus malaysiensis TaxID=1508404 RepID=UPI00384B2DE7
MRKLNKLEIGLLSGLAFAIVVILMLVLPKDDIAIKDDIIETETVVAEESEDNSSDNQISIEERIKEINDNISANKLLGESLGLAVLLYDEETDSGNKEKLHTLINLAVTQISRSEDYFLMEEAMQYKDYIDESKLKILKARFKEQEIAESSTIRIGMTSEEVKKRWGEPNDINKTITSSGTDEQWVYYSKYLYFENDILTAIQD